MACHGICHGIAGMPWHMPWYMCHGMCHSIPWHMPWNAMVYAMTLHGICHGICHGTPCHALWHGMGCAISFAWSHVSWMEAKGNTERICCAIVDHYVSGLWLWSAIELGCSSRGAGAPPVRMSVEHCFRKDSPCLIPYLLLGPVETLWVQTWFTFKKTSISLNCASYPGFPFWSGLLFQSSWQAGHSKILPALQI